MNGGICSHVQEAIENYELLHPRVEFSQKDIPPNTTIPFTSTPMRNNGQSSFVDLRSLLMRALTSGAMMPMAVDGADSGATGICQYLRQPCTCKWGRQCEKYAVQD